MSNQSERYIQLHRELWAAFIGGYYGYERTSARYFLTWLHNHSGIYQPACREYLDILGGMKA